MPNSSTNLLACQRKAISYMRNYALKHKTTAKNNIAEILKMANIHPDTYHELTQLLIHQGKVAIHFHPDRPDHSMKTVLENLLEQGIYKSQFETHISAGDLTAYPGGARDLWEKRLFHGAYHVTGVIERDRPKYGTLNLLYASDGPSPRFGSCYFLLTPDVSKRCTFTYLGSQSNPKEKGTIDQFDDILASVLSDIFFYEHAFGEKGIDLASFFERTKRNLEEAYCDPALIHPSRNLNYFIEAQVHGTISLSDDIELLVADPSFIATPYESLLRELSKKYAFNILWSPGFKMDIEDVPCNFRGNTMPSLAKAIAENGIVTARTIGKGVMDVCQNPEKWRSRGSSSSTIQEFKLLWHVLVKYGKHVCE